MYDHNGLFERIILDFSIWLPEHPFRDFSLNTRNLESYFARQNIEQQANDDFVCFIVKCSRIGYFADFFGDIIDDNC